MNTQSSGTGFVAVMSTILLTGAGVAGGGGPASEQAIPLPPLEVEGMKRVGEAWVACRSVYEEGQEGFCIEAEQASSLLCSADVSGPVSNEGAGGGAYLSDPGDLTFELHTVRGGDYMLLVRLRRNTGSTRGESPDSVAITLGPEKVSAESFRQADTEWSRQSVAGLHLDPGLNTIGLGALPGYDLDRAVLLPRGVDVSDGSLAAMEPGSRRVVAEAAVTTAEVAPLSVAQWKRLVLRGDFEGRAPRLSVSTDQGKTWKDIPANGDLSGIETRGNGQDRLCARVVWHPRGPDQVPRLSGLAVAYVPGEAEAARIAGPGMTLVIDAASGCLHEVRRSESGEWLALPLRR